MAKQFIGIPIKDTKNIRDSVGDGNKSNKSHFTVAKVWKHVSIFQIWYENGEINVCSDRLCLMMKLTHRKKAEDTYVCIMYTIIKIKHSIYNEGFLTSLSLPPITKALLKTAHA